MRSSSLPLLLGCAIALALPSVASAQNFSPIRQPAQFDALPISGTDPTTEPVTIIPVSGDDEWYAYSLRNLFSYVFMNQVFEQVNISTNGYVTFGDKTARYAPGDPDEYNNQTLGADGLTPTGLIAAWWDDLNCPAGSIKSQVFGPAGSRWLVFEWYNCTRASGPTVQVQIRLQEASPIVRVFYGDALASSSSNNATVGIENAATYDAAGNMLTPGGNRAYYGLVDAAGAPSCTNDCNHTHWPAHTMIQYGRPNIPDLGPDPSAAGPALEITGLLKGSDEITATLSIAISNEGNTDATGVTWDYYLSQDDRVDPLDLLLNCQHAPLETVPGARNAVHAIAREDTCVLDLPDAGKYRLCAVLDPANTVVEASEANNTFCTIEFVLGADLFGNISVAEEGGLGSDTNLIVEIRNRGYDPTAQFEYRVFWKDCGSSGMQPLLAHQGTLSLAGGAGVVQTIPVYLDPALVAESLCAELYIDEADVIQELDPNNNTASTCPGVSPDPVCMALTRPDLNINQLLVDMPHGCFYGDVVTLDLEICNLGATTARNFGAVFSLDENSIPTILDTEVIAVPQACSNYDAAGLPYDDSSLCQDIGGGPPVCINGICHAPCTGNSHADCGNTGLECDLDPAWVVDGVRQRSCQLALPGGECKWVRATTNIPTYNTRDAVDFADGTNFFGAIVDWTMLIGEEDENNNKKYSGESYMCWTRKPDFEPTGLRAVDIIGAGEEFPVFRRVHNHGVVGGVFSYRYVLTRNPSPSEWDVALEIVGHGPIADGTVGAFADSDAYDMVRVPAGLVPGDYYLGILVDPGNTVVELFDDNNAMVWCDKQPNETCLPHAVHVADSSLRILTQGLQNATVGQGYNVQFLAAGGNGAYEWTVTDGALPPGLALESNGLLHGTVLEAGDYLFRVTVESGPASTTGTFAIRALPARGPLMIVTDHLPPAWVGVDYTAELGASGGVPPYAWTCAGLPTWAQLSNNVLVGRPSTAAGPVPVTCSVIDGNGQRHSETYPLRVNGADNVQITRTQLECTGGAGQPCTVRVSATGGSGHHTWDFADETIPPGLHEVSDPVDGVLEGTPTLCGTYPVRVTVTDTATSSTDRAELKLVIMCDPPRLTTRNVPAVKRLETVSFQIEAENAVRFALVMGTLPKGLALNENGLIAGTVAVDANTGDHNVAIELSDATGGTTLGALTMVVEAVPPPKVTLRDDVTKGCSTSGESSASGFLPFAALFALLGLRRASARRAAGVALVAAVAALLPATASAQSALGYGAFPRSVVYQRLVGATPANLRDCDAWPCDDRCSEAIDLPFTFTYYGEEYEKVYVNTNGRLLFSGKNTNGGNAVIPSTDAPNNFIAPWADDIEVAEAANLRYLIRGTSPNREFVVEWIAYPYLNDGAAGFEMQVSLYEDNTFAMRWGAVGAGTSSSASVGIEDAPPSARSLQYLACSPNCGQTDWENSLQNREVVFATFANLRVAATITEPEANAGMEQYFGVTIVNDGPKPVPAVDVRLVVSTDREVSDDDFLVGVIPDVVVGGIATVETGITRAMPRALSAGMYYLLATVDPDHSVEEFVETDNDGGDFRFRVVEPAPDLAIDAVGAPGSGIPGSKIAVDLSVANRGNLDASGVAYKVVLSDNAAISPSDLLLHEGTIDIGWLQNTDFTTLIEIPVDTPTGVYYLGAVIDPDNHVAEFDELNNMLASAREFRVTANGLRSDTQIPTELQVGAPFCIPLEAEGGDGVYTWSLVDGDLPPGLTVHAGGEADPYGASLCGEPTAVGLYEFTLGVESGGMTVEMEQSINVVTTPLQLTIASRVLPIATFDQLFEAGLSANGGRTPYRWSVVAGSLPVGLTLAEDGLIFGMPHEDGSFTLQVRVTDAVGAVSVDSVRLQVAPPGRVTCSTHSLGTLKVGEELTGKLLAGGGRRPYDWAAVELQRYGDGGGAVSNMGFDVNALGELGGRPKEIGRYLWKVEVQDAAGQKDVCEIGLEVVSDGGLVVTTTTLPLALADQEFRVQLKATGGTGTLSWKPLTPRPPDDLDLSTDGVLSGKLPQSELQGETSRTFTFLVEVRDAENKRGIGALSVTLTTEKEIGEATHETKTTETGCSASAGGFSLVALGLVVLGLRRRR